jgi:hypothetical protein
MPRKKDPESVGSKVALLKVDESIEFVNGKFSIAVMVSNLKRFPEHSEKKFKLYQPKEKKATIVTRIK